MQKMRYSELKQFLDERMKSFPISVRNVFCNKCSFTGEGFFEISEENGITKITGKTINESIAISLNQSTNESKINKITNFQQGINIKDGEMREEIALKHDKNSFNNEPGYIVTTHEGKSIISFNENRTSGKYTDIERNVTNMFDNNGIELANKVEITEYPAREYHNGYRFEYGITNMRTPIKKTNNMTTRTGLQTAKRYINNYDIMGNNTDKTEENIYLDSKLGSNSQGLAIMHPDKTLNEEEITVLSDYISQHIEEILSLEDPTIARALMEKYGTKVQRKGR